MQIDISKLLIRHIDSIKIDNIINIPHELTTKTLIQDLKNINFEGEIFLDEDNKLNLIGKLNGIMILPDDITLEPFEYQFSTEIEEILEKSKNILDITDILWQNILVEIPSKVRNTDEVINLEGDGWRVISEEQFELERNQHNNPFANLNELLSKKEDR